MIRKSTDEDISEEEYLKIIAPFNDNYHEFLESYVLPEIIAFYIANSFYRNSMWEGTFTQHYNSASDILNIVSGNHDKIKSEVIKLLRIKYALEIINEEPLDLKQIEY